MIDDLKRIAEEMAAAQKSPPGWDDSWPDPAEWEARLTAWIEKWGPFVEAARVFVPWYFPLVMDYGTRASDGPDTPSQAFDEMNVREYGPEIRNLIEAYRKAMEES
jgi:hypothetical protein